MRMIQLGMKHLHPEIIQEYLSVLSVTASVLLWFLLDSHREALMC